MSLKLVAEVAMDGSGFARGLNKAKSEVGQFGSHIKNMIAGAFAIGSIHAAVEKVFATASELVNTSKRLGSTVEEVQLLQQAAKDAGSELGTVAKSLEKIDIARAKALGGDKTALLSFQALGVSKEDLRTKRASELYMGSISDTVKNVNPEQIAAPLREVLGRGAGEGIAVLKTDFEELGKQLKDSGALMSTEVAAKLKVIEDQFDVVSKIIITGLAPAVLTVMEAAIKIANWIGGQVAGEAAYWGSLSVGLGGQSRPIDDIVNASHADAIKRAGNENAGRTASDMFKDAEQASTSAMKPFDAWMENFKAALETAAKGIASPKPDFSKTEDLALKVNTHAQAKTDSLISVGNFLGSGNQGGAAGIIQIAQKQLTESQAQTKILEKQATWLQKLADKPVGDLGVPSI